MFFVLPITLILFASAYFIYLALIKKDKRKIKKPFYLTLALLGVYFLVLSIVFLSSF
jgi:uncharacterized membrane protein